MTELDNNKLIVKQSSTESNWKHIKSALESVKRKRSTLRKAAKDDESPNNSVKFQLYPIH